MTTAGPLFRDPQETNPDLPRVTRRPRIRPRDRRIVQAIALATLLPAFLGLKWMDEADSVQKNLKPPEKVTTVPHGQTGTLADAQWKVVARQARAPIAAGTGPQDDGTTELQVVLAVRPADAAAAKTIGSYGITYFFTDGDGRMWSATGLAAGTPRAGAPARLTVRSTVPRTKAAELALLVKAPKASRRPGRPLPSLRFAP
jgi:hypothetical protein